MNPKILTLGIILVILTGALVLFKGQIYSSLGVPAPDEIQAALQSDNPTIQEESANLVNAAKFIHYLPYFLLGVGVLFLIIGIFAKGKKIEVKKE